jgi:uncharacterized membrane protein YfcA
MVGLVDQSCWMAVQGVILGFALGTVTGYFGAGAGFVLTPVLNIAMGLPMNMAVGTSSCQVLGASGFALLHRIDRRWLGIRVALWMGGGIPGGVWIGSRLVERLKTVAPLAIHGRQAPAVDVVILVVFAVFLGLVTAWLFLDNFILRRGQEDEGEKPKGALAEVWFPPMVHFRTVPHGPFSGPVLLLLGLFVGMLSGLLGIGGGVAMMPILFYLVGQEIKATTLTSTMLVFVIGLCATLAHAHAGNINWPLAVCLIAGAFFGARLGARLQARTTGKRLRQYFSFLVLAATLMVSVRLALL